MEEIYGFHSTPSYIIPPENNLSLPANYNHGLHSSVVDHSYWQPFFRSDDLSAVTASIVTDSVSIETNPDQIILPRCRSNRRRDDDDYDAYRDTLKEKIVSHPSYPKLLGAYIDCQKVGAPVEIASLLDHIRHENDVSKLNATGSGSTCLAVDPELDVFMETSCHLLMKFKSDLARPFDEATVFLGNIQSQLFNLGKDEVTISSDEEVSGCETDNTTQMSQELKDMLLRRFGGRISSLKHEFTKKKKKGKLPKEARLTLLQWWNSHYKWPYPTEGDKITLAETTGLDSKQINNWFINQRKRHWKPSETMQLAVMGHLPLYED